MFFVGDKNNSSKKIECKESNSFTPIKIGRSNNTASNVIKILVGDSNNKAKELYYMPLYDWRGAFSTHWSNLHFEVIAKYSDDLSDRDPENTRRNVDTFIINGNWNNVIGADITFYGANLQNEGFVKFDNFKNFNTMNNYSEYIKQLEFHNIHVFEIDGLCGCDNNTYDKLYNKPQYSALEHISIVDNDTENSSGVITNKFKNSFTHNQNLKSVFVIDHNTKFENSFTSHYDGCIILLKKILNDNLDETYSYKSLIHTESPVLLAYACTENATYYDNGIICINSTDDKSMQSSDYVSMYNSINEIDNIIGGGN